MAFSIGFGSWTCRYSNSSSEYLAQSGQSATGRRGVAAGGCRGLDATLTARNSGWLRETLPGVRARCRSTSAAWRCGATCRCPCRNLVRTFWRRRGGWGCFSWLLRRWLQRRRSARPAGRGRARSAGASADKSYAPVGDRGCEGVKCVVGVAGESQGWQNVWDSEKCSCRPIGGDEGWSLVERACRGCLR